MTAEDLSTLIEAGAVEPIDGAQFRAPPLEVAVMERCDEPVGR